jgi:hypothetical protein
MSTTRESKPWWAMISAEKALGMASQPLTTASPFAQIFLRVFSLTGISLGISRGIRSTTSAP